MTSLFSIISYNQFGHNKAILYDFKSNKTTLLTDNDDLEWWEDLIKNLK